MAVTAANNFCNGTPSPPEDVADAFQPQPVDLCEAFGHSMLDCTLAGNFARTIVRSDIFMNIPTWVQPACYGAVAGAAALAILGFSSWGGWVTRTGAKQAAATETASGIAMALTPYCIAKSKSDPASAAVLAELKAATGYNRRGVIEKAGWATPLGADKPNSQLAASCETELGKSV